MYVAMTGLMILAIARQRAGLAVWFGHVYPSRWSPSETFVAQGFDEGVDFRQLHVFQEL